MGEPTPTIGWRRREDGVIMIWDLPNGAEYAPMASFEERRMMDRVEAQWGDLCREIGAKYTLPDGWLQSHIGRESGGDQRAFRREPTPKHDLTPLTGIGLGQITSHALKGRHRVPAGKKNEAGEDMFVWVGGHSDEEMFDPRLNLTTSAKYLAELAARPETKGDFARVAAAYNHGHVEGTRENRWGMVMTGGHVDAEVRFLNYWTMAQAARLNRAAGEAVADQFNLQDTLESGHVTLRDDDTAPDTPRNT